MCCFKSGNRHNPYTTRVLLCWNRSIHPAPLSLPFVLNGLHGCWVSYKGYISKADVIDKGVLWCSWLSRSPHIQSDRERSRVRTSAKSNPSFCCFNIHVLQSSARLDSFAEGRSGGCSVLTSPASVSGWGWNSSTECSAIGIVIELDVSKHQISRSQCRVD
jgi:hypothetical protein